MFAISIRKALYLLVVIALMSAAFPSAGAVGVDTDGVRVFDVKTPPPGVHPRIFFTQEEVPAMKERLETTRFGEQVRKRFLETYPKALADKSVQLRAWDGRNPTREMIDTYLEPNEGIQQNAAIAALQALLYDDDEIATVCIDWAVNSCRLIQASKELVPGHRLWSTGDENGVTWFLTTEWTVKGIAYVYDFLYNRMTLEQRDVIRTVLADVLRGKRAWGMGWPETKQFSNWCPLGGNMGVIALAIEGEEGYDPEIYDLWVDLMRNWIRVALSRKGANHEDGYVYYALRGGVPFMIAAQRRGANLFNEPNFRKIWTWQAHWEPMTGNFGGYETVYVGSKYMYPDDPVVNMFWARRIGKDYERSMSWQTAIDDALFCMDYDGSYDDVTDLANLGLDTMIYGPRRGVMIARNSWIPGDLQFRINARPDMMFVGHAAVDNGSFSLDALGRNWVYNNVGDKDHSFSSGDFSLVHVDGKAQEMKPPSVKTLAVTNTEAAAGISVDLTYAYNWKWHYYWVTPPKPDQKGTERPAGAGIQTGWPEPPWEQDPSNPYDLGWPESADWMPASITNQPDLGFVGIWQYRQRINEVDSVYRSALMVRGDHPYVLVVDDVKQDDAVRLYEWYMQTPQDIALAAMKVDDIYLCERDEERGGKPFPAPGAKRMLVRCLGPWKDFPKTQPEAYERTNFHVDARMEDHMYGEYKNEERGRWAAVMGRRLAVPYHGPSGDFVMLLYPYETTYPNEEKGAASPWLDNPAGAPMPVTTWNEDQSRLTVEFGDHKDVFTFERRDDSRRRHVTMERDGSVMLDL